MTESGFKNAETLFEGRLRGNQLMLSGLALRPEDARLLWASPRMTEVSWLDLADNRLGDAGARDLANCGFLTHVQYLNLNNNGIGDEGLKTLAASAFLPKLKRLHLKSNPIRGEGIAALFDSETLEGLQTFQFHDGWICKKMEGWRYKPKDGPGF